MHIMVQRCIAELEPRGNVLLYTCPVVQLHQLAAISIVKAAIAITAAATSAARTMKRTTSRLQ